jgi:DNA-binding Lrp family transcriptional regulator
VFKPLSSITLDSFDLAILNILQQNNATPQRVIGEAVSLSAPAVQRRIRRMEEAGVMLSIAADPETRRIVYAEKTWGGSANGKSADFPGFVYGETVSVALTARGHNEPTSASSSCGKAEVLVHQTDFAWRAGLCPDAVAAADHAHDLKAPDRCKGCLHRLEAARWPDPPLERAVIRLDDVVEVLRGAVFDIFRQ